jgi:hypothetical protein
MKGKKVDSPFIAEYIEQCIKAEYLRSEEIVQCAKEEIEKIDREIQKVEKLKIRRSKLLDVITTFQKPQKISKVEEAKLISFYQIQHPEICKFICDNLKKQPCTREYLVNSGYLINDVNFCIKQLTEHKVIAKVGDSFLRGHMFEEYVKFVLREN